VIKKIKILKYYADETLSDDVPTITINEFYWYIQNWERFDHR
jgi:hypothetical protein